MLQQGTVEEGTIVREIHVEASPQVVFEVVTSPSHLREWWPDDAVVEPTPGTEGELLVFGDRTSPDAQIPKITVIEAEPPRLFSFRWIYPDDETAGPGNSLLVTFALEPVDGGTRVRMTETGFREKGWEVAVLEHEYRDHAQGWDHFIPRLGAYVGRLAAAS